MEILNSLRRGFWFGWDQNENDSQVKSTLLGINPTASFARLIFNRNNKNAIKIVCAFGFSSGEYVSMPLCEAEEENFRYLSICVQKAH